MSSEALPRKRIVVVLGMHRSGTSAVARGLKALGVELGERLMPAAAENNEKGFWEDIDANTLDNDVLKHLGHTWDSLGPIDRSVLLRSDLDVFRLRAVELLREKLAGVTVFGMKDPRISRLLPFWKGAFDHVGAEVGYVISSRHPLSVARSLSRRDGMDSEKSHYLWLDHVAACMRDTEASPRVVVDYDLLMARPEEQLRRLAKAMALPFEPSSDGFREYAKDFLSEDLRHSAFAPEDLKPYPNIPADLVEAYTLLHRMARDEASPDAKEVKASFAKVIHRLDEMHPAFAYINRRDVELAGLKKTAVESDERVAFLEHVVGVRDAHVTHLEQEVVTRDGHISNLQQVVGDRESRVAVLDREAGRLVDERNRLVQRLRLDLANELLLAREAASSLGEGEFHGAAIPEPLTEARARLQLYAGEIDELCRKLDQGTPENPDTARILEAIDDLLPGQRAAWGAVSTAAGVLGLSLVESAHELELNRLRLADTLRHVSRDEDRISRLKVTVSDLQDLLARREAEIRARDAIIAERQAHVERLDGILGQVGHRFVSRIGRALAPFPGVRAVLRAPLRMLRRLSGQPGN